MAMSIRFRKSRNSVGPVALVTFPDHHSWPGVMLLDSMVSLPFEDGVRVQLGFVADTIMQG